jgi:pilus assembly protein Flp/PilA
MMWILRISQIASLASDRRAVTSIEYGMIACAVIVGIVGSVMKVGNHLPVIFDQVSAALGQF